MMKVPLATFSHNFLGPETTQNEGKQTKINHNLILLDFVHSS